MQITHREEYSTVTGSTSTRVAVLKAPRGEILDCYGRRIAINRDGYNVVFNKAYVKENINEETLNKNIDYIIRLIQCI